MTAPEAELVGAVTEALHHRRESMVERGFGTRVGIGRRPALLVIDLVLAFTDPDDDLGADLTAEIDATNVVLDRAHELGLPVIFSTVSYPEVDDSVGSWSHKIAGNKALLDDSPNVRVDPRLRKADGDVLLAKTHASCLFRTELVALLEQHDVDTLIITGCTTSGCVRATAVDASSLGLRPVVVSDAVGDRSPLSHVVSLFDLEMKYADVIDVSTLLAELAQTSVE
jgi:nicotinamidase-related amidase